MDDLPYKEARAPKSEPKETVHPDTRSEAIRERDKEIERLRDLAAGLSIEVQKLKQQLAKITNEGGSHA